MSKSISISFGFIVGHTGCKFLEPLQNTLSSSPLFWERQLPCCFWLRLLWLALPQVPGEWADQVH